MRKNLLIRADASTEIGTGHVMRCLALAQALQENGVSVTFFFASLPDPLKKRITGENCTCLTLASIPYGKQDAEETVTLARDIGAEWVIVDGYSFDAGYQDALKNQGLKMLFIDDYGHSKRYSADIVLNQNVYAQEAPYHHRLPETTLLLGSRYVLLRREFGAWQSWERKTPVKAKKILVTLGGADPTNATQKVLEAIQHRNLPVEVTAIIGGSYPHLTALRQFAKSTAVPMQIVVNATDMPALMAEADLAVCTGGSTCYELAFMQLPMATIVLAENQERVAAALEERGCSVNLGKEDQFNAATCGRVVNDLLHNPERRAAMARAGRQLVDGEGAARVAMRLSGALLRLRRARPDDARRIWEWTNDPETRRASFSSDPIPWEKHMQWFERLLQDPQQECLMAVDAEGNPIGQLRFAMENDDATLSINIAPGRRGKGYGKELALQGARRLFRAKHMRSIHAYSKPDNTASARLFLGAGFSQEEPMEIRGHPALHFTLTKDMLSP